MSELLIKKIMTLDVSYIDCSKTVFDAMCLLSEKNTSHLIVTKKGLPYGMFSSTDVSKHCVKSDSLLCDVMSTPLIMTKPEDNILNVSKTMTTNNISALPVFSDGLMVGIITLQNIVEAFSVASDSSVKDITHKMMIRLAISDKIKNHQEESELVI
ncbi:CBS domain-containing protein [Nitrosopumilus sp. Nsub]|uniref:CBS domain-containing protein n=1 Tax=Nitrosopumilus sp. Nsub TaxID=1776294 RepID=UPI0008298DD0|nr:CBS domain-containing protein [Nitrosopumilus sp. Nsub]